MIVIVIFVNIMIKGLLDKDFIFSGRLIQSILGGLV